MKETLHILTGTTLQILAKRRALEDKFPGVPLRITWTGTELYVLTPRVTEFGSDIFISAWGPR